MKHGIGRKLLSVVLAVMMLVSLLPTAAFADDSAEPIVVNSVVGDSNTGNDTKLADEALVNVGDTSANEGEGEETTTPVSTPVAKIGNTGYATLDDAITAVQNGETIEVNAGEYTLNGSLNYTGKAFTIAAADGADVSFDMSAAVALHGAKITFNNVTFNYKTNGNYIGLQHTDTLVYNNCTINGMVFLYAVNETFNNCTFNQTSAGAYNVWTYGAQNVAFNGCTFNCVGRCVLVYNEGAIDKTDLTVENTEFNASAPAEGKAAIEIDTSLMAGGATITVDEQTTAKGFDNGSNSGKTLWNDKKQTADTNKNTTVTVAGETVFEPVATAAVAKIGETEYATLPDAVKSASAGDTIVLLNDINLTSYQTIGKQLTIDLNGKTISSTGYQTIRLISGADLTVKDSGANGKITNAYKGSANPATIYLKNAGTTFTLESGTIESDPNETSLQSVAINSEKVACTVNISGGSVTVPEAATEGRGIVAGKGMTLNISGGTITGGLHGVDAYGGSTTNITGGTISARIVDTGVIEEAYGMRIIGTANVTVDGGEITGVKMDDNGYKLDVPNVTLKSGKIKGSFYSITKGTITFTVDDNATITFANDTAKKFLPDTVELVQNEDGSYGVKAAAAKVAKIGDKYYPTLADAIAAAEDGDTITLLADVTENVEIAKEKNLTLDLNGSDLNGGTGTAKAALTNYGTITIKDSSADKTGTIKRDDKGTTGETSYYVIRNQGTMTIESGIVSNNSGYRKANSTGSMVGSSLICNGDCDEGGTLTINGGTFTQNNFIAIKNGALGVLHVTGGKITSNHSAIQNWFEADITGGEINGQLWTDAWKEGESVGKTTIGGDATFTGEIVMDIYGSVAPTLAITGGKLDVTNWNITTAAAKAGAKPAVSGGTFTSAVPAEYCAEGFIPTDNGDGTFGVKSGAYAAQIGDVKYETLQEAIDAAKPNATVTMLANTEENVTISTRNLTLDLNGFTLNGGTVAGKPALTVTARMTVIKDGSTAQTGTIMREDTAENSGISSHYVIDIQGNGWLTFEGGNVKNNSGIVGATGASLVRVGDDSVAKYPGLTIKGGTFTQDNFIVIKVDRGDLFLNGGTLNSANSYAVENWFRATIKGGTVNGAVSSWTYSAGSNSTLTISGGTINGDVTSVNYGNAEGKKATVAITGGTINGELDTRSYDPKTNELTSINDAAKATIKVTGGTFKNNPTKYVVEGSTVKTNSDGTFGVEKAYLAKVGDTSYYTMEEAFKAQTTSGADIVMLRDYTTGSQFKSGSINRTVDLDGHTWTYTGTDTNDAAFEINYSNVTLTVKNGTVVSNSMVGLIPSAMGGTITYDNSGLVFENVTMTANGHSGIETNGNNTNDTVTLKDSTLNVPNGFGIYFPSSGTLTIDNSTINAKTMGVQVCSGSLSINEGSKITVTGDAVPKTENDGAIQDGAAISIVNRTGYKGLGKIEVTGGTFKANGTNAAIKAYNWANNTAAEFTANETVAVSGGTFSSAVPAGLCAPGYVPTEKDENGYYTVAVKDDIVAVIGDKEYTTLSEALKDAAKNGGTVLLMADVDANEDLVRVKYNVTLDLNGHSITNADMLYVNGQIKDSASVKGFVSAVDYVINDLNDYTPVYNSAEKGYSFFNLGMNSRWDTTENKAKFALKNTNDRAAAVALMVASADDRRVKAVVTFSWEEQGTIVEQSFTFLDTKLSDYLTTVPANQLYVVVNGLDQFTAHVDMQTKFVIYKENGAELFTLAGESSPVNYEK